MTRFSERLKKLMTERGMTQKDLAEKIGVTQAAVNKYLNMDMTPNGPTLVAIAKVFKVSEGYLLGEIERIDERKGAVVTEPVLEYGATQKSYYQKTIEILEIKINNLMAMVDGVERYNDELKNLRGTLIKEIQVKNEFLKSIGV